jgi:hypothetical protein
MVDLQVPRNEGEIIVSQKLADVTGNTLPIVGEQVYTSSYNDLEAYRADLNLTGPMLVRHIFSFLAKKFADKVWVSPGTLRTKWSMLRSVALSRRELVADDETVHACERWIKGLARTHNPKQSLQLTKE